MIKLWNMRCIYRAHVYLTSSIMSFTSRRYETDDLFAIEVLLPVKSSDFLRAIRSRDIKFDCSLKNFSYLSLYIHAEPNWICP